MKHNFLLDKFDRLISQTKEYITEKNNRISIVKEIEMEAADIQSDIISKRDEIRALLGELDNSETDYDLKQKLNQSVDEINFFEKNILIQAEKKWMAGYLNKERGKYTEKLTVEREKYVRKESRRIKNELLEIVSFYDIAELVNQVWADHEIFREFNCLEELIRAIVQRMNQTNQKSTETHLSKDPLKTLEHIRINLFKNNCWADDDLVAYQDARNREIRKHHVFSIKTKQPLQFYIVGGSEELSLFIKEQYSLPSNLHLNWVDIDDGEINPKKFNVAEQVIIATYFPKNALFENLVSMLKSEKIPYTVLENYTPSLIFKLIEESFSRFNLKKVFS